MEITTRVCDICYYNGSFKDNENLYNCGELGDLCEEHFKEAYNFLTNKKKENILPETTLLKTDNTYVAKGTDVNTGEEVAVTFDSNGKAEAKPDYTAVTRKKLPWL